MKIDVRFSPTITRLIVVTCLFFILQVTVRKLTGLAWVEGLGALVLQDPEGLPCWQVWRLFTYALLHYNVYHLLMNMLGLWLVGATLEDALGGRRLLGLYALSVMLGGLSALLVNYLGWGNPQGHILMGASAGTLGVLFTYICLEPRSTMYIWLLVLIPIKSLYLGIAMIAYQVVGLLTNSGSNVSYSAHLGGMLGGFFVAQALLRHWDRAASQGVQTLRRHWRQRHIKIVK